MLSFQTQIIHPLIIKALNSDYILGNLPHKLIRKCYGDLNLVKLMNSLVKKITIILVLGGATATYVYLKYFFFFTDCILIKLEKNLYNVLNHLNCFIFTKAI